MDTITREQAVKLAEFISAIRPDWHVPGIVKALSDARARGDVAQVAQAAVRAAATPTNRTPAVIAMPGAHWDNAPDITDRQGQILRQEMARAQLYDAEIQRRKELSGDHLAGDHAGRPTSDCPRCAPAYAEVSA